jgi:hypothetical protein
MMAPDIWDWLKCGRSEITQRRSKMFRKLDWFRSFAFSTGPTWSDNSPPFCLRKKRDPVFRTLLCFRISGTRVDGQAQKSGSPNYPLFTAAQYLLSCNLFSKDGLQDLTYYETWYINLHSFTTPTLVRRHMCIPFRFLTSLAFARSKKHLALWNHPSIFFNWT